MKHPEAISASQTLMRFELPSGTVGVIGSIDELAAGGRKLVASLPAYAGARSVAKSPSEGDCAMMAGAAVKEFARRFEQQGYALTITRTQSPEAIPRYKEFGYGHHVINMAIGEDDCFAFDVTASYTLPREGVQLLLVTGKNETEVLSRLSSFTNSRWTLDE